MKDFIVYACTGFISMLNQFRLKPLALQHLTFSNVEYALHVKMYVLRRIYDIPHLLLGTTVTGCLFVEPTQTEQYTPSLHMM